jgi:hypothetical protein
MLVSATYLEGAPSLRFLQGWAAMPPTHFLAVVPKHRCHAFVVPALCKVREERGIRCLPPHRIKAWATRHRLDEPATLSLGMVASLQCPLPFRMAEIL